SSAVRSTTVRQTPFTARLSPSVRSGASAVARRSRTPPPVGRASTTCPTDSMRPVNISFNQHVGSDRLHSALRTEGGEQPPTGEKPDTAGSEHVRRDIEPGEVDHPFVPGRSVEGGTAFEEHGRDA